MPPVAPAEPSGGSASERTTASLSRTTWTKRASGNSRASIGTFAVSSGAPSTQRSSLSPISEAAARPNTREKRSGPKPSGCVRAWISGSSFASSAIHAVSIAAGIAGCWPSAHASALTPERGAPITKTGRGGPPLRSGFGGAAGRGATEKPSAGRPLRAGPASWRSCTGGAVLIGERSGVWPVAAAAALRLACAHSISITCWRLGDLRPVALAVVSEFSRMRRK